MLRLIILFFVLMLTFPCKGQDTIVGKTSTDFNKYIIGQASTSSINYWKIVSRKGRYYYTDGITLKKSEPLGIHRILVTANNLSFKKDIPELQERVNKTERNIKKQKGFGIAGIPCLGAGLGLQFIALVMSTGNGPNGNDELAFGISSVGATVFLAGLTFEVSSIINGFKKKKHLKETVDMYNMNL